MFRYFFSHTWYFLLFFSHFFFLSSFLSLPLFIMLVFCLTFSLKWIVYRDIESKVIKKNENENVLDTVHAMATINIYFSLTIDSIKLSRRVVKMKCSCKYDDFQHCAILWHFFRCCGKQIVLEFYRFLWCEFYIYNLVYSFVCSK